MGSRERKRAERRKRKARSAERRPRPSESQASAATETTAAEVGAAAEGSAAAEQGPMQRGYARAEERNREAREALVPLREGERPTVVTIAAVISALLSASMLVGYAAGIEVDGERPKFVQVIAPALITGIMAWGLWKARYWAVLGFQTILLFLIFAAAFGLTLAGSALQVVANVLLLAVAGAFFYLMIKAMARIQMPRRIPRE